MALIRRPTSVEVKAKVEDVFEVIVDSLLREEQIHISLKYKRPVTTSSGIPDLDSAAAYSNVTFPARTPQEARRFCTIGNQQHAMILEAYVDLAVLLRILTLIYEALSNDEVISKRSIYYKDPALFGSQRVVDKYVDILAYTFGIQRAGLNVTAAAKGLVAGEYSLIFSDGTSIHYNSETPRLIDDTANVQNIDISKASWILVIEKEATFRTLASSRLDKSSGAGTGVILTAKGYPDISTRAFLHLMSKSRSLKISLPPIYALTDFDPDGMAIMSTYKHGSWNLSHESSRLLVPRLRWLGLQSTDIMNSARDEEYKGLLRLSGRDRRKAVKMLENSPIFREEGEELQWRRELQVMLMLSVKAEMEILSEREEGVTGWVEGKLLEHSTLPASEEDLDEMII